MDQYIMPFLAVATLAVFVIAWTRWEIRENREKRAYASARVERLSIDDLFVEDEGWPEGRLPML